MARDNSAKIKSESVLRFVITVPTAVAGRLLFVMARHSRLSLRTVIHSQRLQSLTNRRVHFRIRDIYHPDPTSMLLELHGDDVIQGEVVAITDSGERAGVYAVVKADDLEQPVIVQIGRLGGAL